MKSNLLKYTLGISSLLLLSTTSTMADSNNSEIDTLVLYSQGAKDDSNGDIETKVNHLFTTTNKIYEDSGLNVTLNAVKIEQLDLNDSTSTNDILEEVQSNSEVQALRDTVGADEVIIYRPYANDGLCGLAYYNPGYQAYAYAHVSIDCGAYVTGHEVGHNMHLAHSAKQDPNAGYGRGHGVDDQFVTVMAYSASYNGTKVYKFSDPALDCNGEPCGIEAGLDNEADAVKKIKIQAPIIANFRERVIIDDTNETDKTDDTHNKIDDNNSDDNNDDTNSNLETAKKAYEAQILVRDEAKAQLQSLREALKTVRTTAKANYQTKVQEARATFNTKKATARATLTTELNALKAQYITARTNRKATKITADEFTAIVVEIRAERTAKKAVYKETVTSEKATLTTSIQTLKEEKNESISEAKTTLSTYKTEVYFVEVQKLKELRQAYKNLLNASN